MSTKEGNIINLNNSSRAKTGYIDKDFRTGYRVRIKWTINSQNASNNTSNVTVETQLISTGTHYTISSSATKNGSLTINGTEYKFTFSASLNANQTKTLFTKTVDIAHNSDGTKTCSLETSVGLNVTLSGVYWGTITANGNATFDTIPRTSSFTLNTTDVTLGSTQLTININRASNDFVHKIYYKFGSLNVLKTSNATTSYSFTPSLSDCSQIPSSTSGSGTIIVETWSNNTLIGSTSKNITLLVPENVKPSFTSLTSTVVDNGAGTSYGYIKGKTKAKLTINGAAGNQGSTITSYYIWGGDFTSSSSSFTTGALNKAGTITFTGYVVDSRGRKSENKTVSISVQDYESPIIKNALVFRCTSNGTSNENGTYIKVAFETIYSKIAQNTTTNKIEYKITSASSWTNAGSLDSNNSLIFGNGNILTNSTYDVKITVSDKFETITKIYNVAPAFVTLDFKKGGRGIGIGKVSEQDNLLDINMDTKVTGNMTITKQLDGNVFVLGNGNNGMIKMKSTNNTPHTVMYINTSNYFKLGDVALPLYFYSSDNPKVMVKDTACTMYHTGNKPTKNDVGLSNVNNWSASTSVSESSTTMYATASAVKQAYDKANHTHPYLSNAGGTLSGNLTISTGGAAIKADAGSGYYFNHLAEYTGSKGTEPTLAPSGTGGWGAIGTSSKPLMKMFSYGYTNASERRVKYDISKIDNETLYDYVKDINVYGYRHISQDQEEKLYRKDLQIGCMVDELPTEVVDYDNEGGEGKSVDIYAYATMITGATKHLQEIAENLTKENEELKLRLEKMEELINGIINKR